MLGFLGAGLGMAILAIPGVSLHGIGTAFALIPIGLGLGMLFVPVSRAALNATPDASHGRVSAVLSAARLVGAAIGAGLAGAALSGGPSASTVHTALAVAAGACLLLGLPLASQFGARASRQLGPAHGMIGAPWAPLTRSIPAVARLPDRQPHQRPRPPGDRWLRRGRARRRVRDAGLHRRRG